MEERAPVNDFGRTVPSAVCLLQSTENKKKTFHIKDDNDKLWVEVILVTSLDAVATVYALTANNNDVNLVETRNALCARLLNRRLVFIA